MTGRSRTDRVRGVTRLGVAAVALTLLLSCERRMSETTPASSAAPPTAGALRLLALGDSYTIGEAVEPRDRWPNQLHEALRRREHAGFGSVRIIARTGWTTDELSTAINAAGDLAPPYDLVTLLIGVNNQYRGRDVATFRPEFAALLERAVGFAGGSTDRVLVLSIPDWGVMPFANGRDRAKIAAEIDAYNAVCRDEASRRAVRFVDVTPISRRAKTQPDLCASDDLHPSGEQYRLWAEAVADVLTARGTRD